MSSTPSSASLPEHVQHLRGDKFLRDRVAPEHSDYYYLHLADLLAAIRAHASDREMVMLDFGAGGSPYRSLFPRADYRTADFGGATYEISPEGRTNAPDRTFDLVLSTQVLEHCRSPERYLEEVRRVLKPGGRLLLSTHGLFEEHACPDDFYRWTADGLKVVLEQNGFMVHSVDRVTVGPRAAFHLLQSALSMPLLDGKPFWLRLLARPLFRLLLARRFWNGLLDRLFPEYCVVSDARLPFSNTFVTVLADAYVAGADPDRSS